ncbi:MAG: peptidase, partial [Finegoldia magna]|nr:peptidase [Finegoldia magna]
MERLINILKQNEKITDWIVVNTVSKSNEVFLIKDKVDMNRSCVTNETSVRVFVDFEENGDKFKGDSTVVLNLNDSEDEIKEKIDRTAFAAKFVKNKYYELPEKEEGYATLKDIKVCEDLTDNFKKVHDVIYKDYGYQSKVNSCEIFAYENHKHVVTSKGVDVEYPS